MKNMPFFIKITLLLSLFSNCENDGQSPSSKINTEVIGTNVLQADTAMHIGNFTVSKDKVKEIQKNILANLTIVNKDFKSNKIIIKTSLFKNSDDHYFLRTEFNNGYVSTSLLPVTSNKNARVLVAEAPVTTCTSTSCSSGGGCQPQIDGYCSACSKGTKDCTRSTSH